MDFLLVYVLKRLLLPPGANLLLLLLAAGINRHRPRLAKGLAALALCTLYLASTLFGATRLAAGLETSPALSFEQLASHDIDAIVVPGTGRYLNAPEFGTDTVSVRTLERLRYAARLHRASGWPIAVVGGSPLGGRPEGELMRETLEQDFGVPVAWVEAASRDTAENARFARQLLSAGRIVLVTQATDMPRARRAFTQAGFEVLAAPIGFVSGRGAGEVSALDFMPDAEALNFSRIALYEYLGSLWYRWRY